MTISTALRRLANAIDDLDREGVHVTEVDRCTGKGDIVVDLRLRIDGETTGTVGFDDGRGDSRPSGAGPSREGRSTVDPNETALRAPESASDPDATGTNHDGSTEADRTPDERPDADSADGASSPSSVDGAGEDEQVRCRNEGCGATFDTEHGMKIHYTKVHLSGGDVSGSPPHRDPEALRRVYEEYDSFTQMRDALGTDASAQTVRRQMMKHGIHDPEDGNDGAGASGSEDSGEPEAAAEDGSTGPDASDDDAPRGGASTLPVELSTDDLEAAVADADTLLQVQRELGLDRETTADLLSSFDLLELVHGRVATKAARDERKAEISQRIARSTPDRQPSSSD